MLSTALLLSAAFAQDLDAPPIVGGEETTDFSPVGTLVMVYNGSIYGSFCSGTLADDDWVVTAAHCVEAGIDYERQGLDIYFCTGSSLYTNRGIDECDLAIDLIEHPDYNARSLDHDIGLLELSAGLRASGAYALNTTHPRNFSVSESVTYVGWGITGDNRNDSGVKRTVDVPFYDNGGTVGYDSQYLYTWDPRGEKNICSGDSGGAGLLYQNGEWTLIGVNSHGFDLQGGYPNCEGDYAAAGIARVDAYYDWLNGYIGLEDGGNNGGGGGDNNNGGGGGDNNNGGGGGDNNGGGDEEPEDTGSFDTADPGDGKGGKGGKNNGNGKDDSFGTCSSVPLRTGGLMGMVLLGAALVGRRRD